MPKRPSIRGVKAARTYTLQEVAELTGVTIPTVRAWIKAGLPAMTSRRPYLVRGAELRRFLIARRDEARCQLGAGQLYCLSCRAARQPEGDQVSYVAQTPKAGRIQGHCGTCGARCARMVSAARLPEITQHLNVA